MAKFTKEFTEHKKQNSNNGAISDYIYLACKYCNNPINNSFGGFWHEIVNSELDEDYKFECLSYIFNYADEPNDKVYSNIINQNKNSIYYRHYQDIDNDDEYEKQINDDKPNGILCFLLCQYRLHPLSYL